MVRRGVKESFFNRRVRLTAPLPEKVSAQHLLQRKRWAAGMPLVVVRRNQRDQRGLENDALHLLQQLALAGFLHSALEV